MFPHDEIKAVYAQLEKYLSDMSLHVLHPEVPNVLLPFIGDINFDYLFEVLSHLLTI